MGRPANSPRDAATDVGRCRPVGFGGELLGQVDVSGSRIQLRGLLVLVDQSAKDPTSTDVTQGRVGGTVDRCRTRIGRSLTEGPVRPMGVVVRHIGSQDGLEMTPAHDEYPVQALAVNRAHEPFGVSIGARCLYR